ncbi:hypothetical protein [Thalassoporum mexicanum]|nr:hypothetical protein [Pseudanabaena sp. PCC 7367]
MPEVYKPIDQTDKSMGLFAGAIQNDRFEIARSPDSGASTSHKINF